MNTKGATNNKAARPTQSDSNALLGLNLPQKSIMGIILVVALVAFELFNFDTTRYALGNLLGDVRFAGVGWATILAIAFCAIDFAGLARLFTPERGKDEPTAVWYLMGAWLLGATMNAVMTWWAISLTLLSHDFGNEVLSREQLLRWVPFFVATLVWLTRILFIGAISVAGEYMFAGSLLQHAQRSKQRPSATTQRTPTGRPYRPNPAPMRAAPRRENGRPRTRSRNNRPNPSRPSRTDMKAPGHSSGPPRR
ncbi:hypothetical protein [Candidatus Leptofilum sp.]|uniref:hypothetical protein n=1 Tax=Candidatus Leptofilum sp. TaxID=3241576 RepID=UPI003B5AD18F